MDPFPFRFRRYDGNVRGSDIWIERGAFSSMSAEPHPIRQIVMPIYKVDGDEIRPLGTGFVIQQNGIMMTAAHVLA